jgi:hypothetical protein
MDATSTNDPEAETIAARVAGDTAPTTVGAEAADTAAAVAAAPPAPTIPKGRKPRFFVINGEVLPDPTPGQPIEAALAAFELSFPGTARATLTEYEEAARVLLEVDLQQRVGTKGLTEGVGDHARLLAQLGHLPAYRPALRELAQLLALPEGEELDGRLLDPATEIALQGGERESRSLQTLASRLADLFR